jgi:hypothetical protein
MTQFAMIEKPPARLPVTMPLAAAAPAFLLGF